MVERRWRPADRQARLPAEVQRLLSSQQRLRRKATMLCSSWKYAQLRSAADLDHPPCDLEGANAGPRRIAMGNISKAAHRDTAPRVRTFSSIVRVVRK